MSRAITIVGAGQAALLVLAFFPAGPWSGDLPTWILVPGAALAVGAAVAPDRRLKATLVCLSVSAMLLYDFYKTISDFWALPAMPGHPLQALAGFAVIRALIALGALLALALVPARAEGTR